MLSQSIVGIYLVGLVVLKFPLSIISGYLIEIFRKVASTYLSSDDGDNACVHGRIWVYQLWQIIGFVLHMPYLQSFGDYNFQLWTHNYGCNYRRRGTLYLQD